MSFELNTGMMDLPMPIIAINSDEEFTSSVNNITAKNHEWYRRYYAFNVVIPSLFNYGGNWYIEGVRTDPEYEWQIATSYGYQSMTQLTRRKYAGVWGEWVNTGISYDYVTYTSISDKIQTNDATKLVVNASYVENRTVVIRLSAKAGSSGLITAKITDPKFRPRYYTNGTYTSMSDGKDHGKCIGSTVSYDGDIQIWLSSALYADELVTFMYPIQIPD